jgi:hypothetical protein
MNSIVKELELKELQKLSHESDLNPLILKKIDAEILKRNDLQLFETEDFVYNIISFIYGDYICDCQWMNYLDLATVNTTFKSVLCKRLLGVVPQILKKDSCFYEIKKYQHDHQLYYNYYYVGYLEGEWKFPNLKILLLPLEVYFKMKSIKFSFPVLKDFVFITKSDFKILNSELKDLISNIIQLWEINTCIDITHVYYNININRETLFDTLGILYEKLIDGSLVITGIKTKKRNILEI